MVPIMLSCVLVLVLALVFVLVLVLLLVRYTWAEHGCGKILVGFHILNSQSSEKLTVLHFCQTETGPFWSARISCVRDCVHDVTLTNITVKTSSDSRRAAEDSEVVNGVQIIGDIDCTTIWLTISQIVARDDNTWAKEFLHHISFQMY